MDSEATILERIADLAAIAQPPYEKVLLDAAQEIERLRQRECEAIKVIEAFSGPDRFHGWHDKYDDAVRKARKLIGA
ncbi:hypothetical protein [Thalassolituus marinus]|uniref:Uncharacterized protein n=1 Tax=Thalassolituus marinus TaxID=671053 RepID=A0ABS7ZWC1_9GAMM|nr:hypothetical protein [Thalassolituus marinus]MCA6065462.1 hypothetical protein [Thalassolituus marinus]